MDSVGWLFDQSNSDIVGAHNGLQCHWNILLYFTVLLSKLCTLAYTLYAPWEGLRYAFTECLNEAIVCHYIRCTEDIVLATTITKKGWPKNITTQSWKPFAGSSMQIASKNNMNPNKCQFPKTLLVSTSRLPRSFIFLHKLNPSFQH